MIYADIAFLFAVIVEDLQFMQLFDVEFSMFKNNLLNIHELNLSSYIWTENHFKIVWLRGFTGYSTL